MVLVWQFNRCLLDESDESESALTLVVQIYPGLVVLESSVKPSLGVQALATRAWFGKGRADQRFMNDLPR